jgi:hypothetical protein
VSVSEHESDVMRDDNESDVSESDESESDESGVIRVMRVRVTRERERERMKEVRERERVRRGAGYLFNCQNGCITNNLNRILQHFNYVRKNGLHW